MLHFPDQIGAYHNAGDLFDGQQILFETVNPKPCHCKAPQGAQQRRQGGAGFQQAQQGRTHHEFQQVRPYGRADLSQTDPEDCGAVDPGPLDHKGTAGQDAVLWFLFFLFHVVHLTATV